MTVPQALGIALEHQRAGRLINAEALYRQVLVVQPDNADALHLMGVLASQAGRHEAAVEWIRRSIEIDPRNAAAQTNLGEAYRAMDRFDEAVASYGRALELEPKLRAARHNLAIALTGMGRLDEAMAAFRGVLESEPNFPDAHNGLGIVLARQGQTEEALASYRRAIELRPTFAEAHTNLGIALAENGKFEEAVASQRRANELQPESPEIWRNLGTALAAQRHFADAIRAFRQAVRLRPGYAEAYSNLGSALRDTGQLDEAISACREAIRGKADFAEAHHNLGNALLDRGWIDEAVASQRRAIQLQPDSAEGHNSLGNGLMEQGCFDEAVKAYRDALALRPGYPQAQHNLGVALIAQGRLNEALAFYREALRLAPENPEIHGALLYVLHFVPSVDRMIMAGEQQRWARQFVQPLERLILPHTNDRIAARRLRIGYVSPEFRDHVTGRYLHPLFQSQDRRDFEIICYSGVLNPDKMTEVFQRRADRWRTTVGISDEELAELICRDGVDILVDLTQHLAGNRLSVFARKPAPVQVSFAGYPEGTGLGTIEYRISDRYLEAGASEIPSAGSGQGPIGNSEFGVRSAECGIPTQECTAGSASQIGDSGPDIPHSASQIPHSERVFLIDSFWCYDPCGLEVPVNELPAKTSGRITFGSLNNFCKINEPMLKVWARVLARADGSRLVLLSGFGSHRERTIRFLEREGIEPQRIEFVAPRPRREYLELYHGVDIALDPFPYGGHTTSLDALWMGVPVVSLAGERPVSRAGLSILNNLGLPELVAFSENDYVKIAVELAGDLPRIEELRRTLRFRMEASVLMDAPRFARSIEAAYRAMWRQWCEQNPA